MIFCTIRRNWKSNLQRN